MEESVDSLSARLRSHREKSDLVTAVVRPDGVTLFAGNRNITTLPRQDVKPLTMLKSGNLRLDVSKSIVVIMYDDIEEADVVDLTATQREILAVLMLRKGAVVSREEIIAGVTIWQDGINDIHAVDVHVSNLRLKLRTAGSTVDIVTVRSNGWRLDE